MKSANGEDQTDELKNFEQSVFKSDFCIEKLKREHCILVDAIHVVLPHVKKGTSIRTISDAVTGLKLFNLHRPYSQYCIQKS